MASKKSAVDTACDTAVKKIGAAIDACKNEDIDKITRLCEALAKMVAARGKNPGDGGGEWGTGLKPKRGEK
jgi:PHP family Zn ribbon phosphoesterase